MYTLKRLAEAGYIMGLATIGEVASHMELHYDAYFLITDVQNRTGEYAEFLDAVASHEDASIFLWLTEEDKRRLDDDLERAMNGDDLREATDEKDEEDGEEENKHF